MRHIAYISVGSNLGDRLVNCQNGIDSLTRAEDAVLIKQAPFYITEPVDYEDQNWFINSVVQIETVLDPFQLFDMLKAIEGEGGRTDTGVRFGPRTLDLDILLFDELVIASPALEIPHPRMHKRRFVLKPMCDIDPEVVHPVSKTDMKTLLNSLGDDGQRVVRYT